MILLQLKVSDREQHKTLCILNKKKPLKSVIQIHSSVHPRANTIMLSCNKNNNSHLLNNSFIIITNSETSWYNRLLPFEWFSKKLTLIILTLRMFFSSLLHHTYRSSVNNTIWNSIGYNRCLYFICFL